MPGKYKISEEESPVRTNPWPFVRVGIYSRALNMCQGRWFITGFWLSELPSGGKGFRFNCGHDWGIIHETLFPDRVPLPTFLLSITFKINTIWKISRVNFALWRNSVYDVCLLAHRKFGGCISLTLGELGDVRSVSRISFSSFLSVSPRKWHLPRSQGKISVRLDLKTEL